MLTFFFSLNVALESVKVASCVELKSADIEISGFPSASVCLEEDLQTDVWARQKKLVLSKRNITKQKDLNSQPSIS